MYIVVVIGTIFIFIYMNINMNMIYKILKICHNNMISKICCI